MKTRGGAKRTAPLAISAALALWLASSATAAPSYEPNDSIPAASGPLAAGQAYTAAIETPADRDLFYFYVTAPSPAPVTLSFKNLGGGSEASALNAAIVDSQEIAIDPFAYAIGAGGATATTLALEPGKYYVEVSAVEGSAGTTSYSLATGSGAGTFGSYEQIARRCTDASAAYKADKTALRAAQGKLQRATARLRRSRFASATLKRSARAGYRGARRNADAKQEELSAASKAREPWCSIGQ